MSVRILHGDIHLIDLATRLPFKYGIATMTRAPQAFVRLVLDVDGREVRGIAADLLPPRWFTKNPEQTLDQEISEMLQVIEHAVGRSVGLAGDTVFDVWQELAGIQSVWGSEQGYPPLLSQFGTTLIERALIEGFCRAAGKPFSHCLRSNALGVRLEHFDKRLRGRSPLELLQSEPLRRITARHTVGMADSLEESEIDPPTRLNDGLPQSLAECIRYYGLRHFKLKLSGAAGPDIERLTRIAAVIERGVSGSYAFTLDGNESFRSLDSFREYWSSISRAPGPERFLSHMMFVEQPFHREVALDAVQLGGLSAWAERPNLIIDESDAEIDSLSRALAIGYHGTSHKNCKGVFKGVANACLLALLRGEDNNQRLVMSGEDLANIGPVALLQDLAVVASLGVGSVERNGHHYFAGLSAFPRDIQENILQEHSDLYRPATEGWPTLRIADGELALGSVVDAPLGVGFELDVSQFTPADSWRDKNLSREQQP